MEEESPGPWDDDKAKGGVGVDLLGHTCSRPQGLNQRRPLEPVQYPLPFTSRESWHLETIREHRFGYFSDWILSEGACTAKKRLNGLPGLPQCPPPLPGCSLLQDTGWGGWWGLKPRLHSASQTLGLRGCSAPAERANFPNLRKVQNGMVVTLPSCCPQPHNAHTYTHIATQTFPQTYT